MNTKQISIIIITLMIICILCMSMQTEIHSYKERADKLGTPGAKLQGEYKELFEILKRTGVAAPPIMKKVSINGHLNYNYFVYLEYKDYLKKKDLLDKIGNIKSKYLGKMSIFIFIGCLGLLIARDKKSTINTDFKNALNNKKTNSSKKLEDKFDKLKKLKNVGILTDEEYKRKIKIIKKENL